VPSDASSAAWIQPERNGKWGTVGNIVPAGFEAYARVLHPATTAEGEPRRWEEIAVELGRQMHPLVQWHALVGLAGPDELPGPEWPGSPETGFLDVEILKPLCALLRGHTERAEECYFGLWAGWTMMETVSYPEGTEPPPETFEPRPWSGDDIPGPRFDLRPGSGREYALLRGPLGAAVALAESHELGTGSPALIWPADRAWFLATDIDYDSTLIGGSAELVDAILGADELEAWRIRPDDSLAADADAINRP